MHTTPQVNVYQFMIDMWLAGWSLTSLFGTNMTTSEKNDKYATMQQKQTTVRKNVPEICT